MKAMKYAEMKDSGVEWIGEVPKGWKIVPARFFSSVQAGYPFDSEKFSSISGIPLIRIRDITSGCSNTFFNGDYPSEYLVRNDDLLVGMDGDFNVRWWQGGEAVLNQRCCRISCNRNLLKRFFYYVLPFHLRDINNLAYSTTVKHLANDDIGKAQIPLPPLPEQQAIAAYLDDKCAAIDDVIAGAKSTIEEYKAWKASVIFEAITKGLDPNAEMKDSGVEWIGDVPKNTDVVKLKYLISGYKAGPFGSALITDALLPQGDILVYTPEHIALKSTDSPKNQYLPPERTNEMEQFFVKPGEFIFPIVGSLGRAMRISPSMPRGIINQRLAKFTVNEKRLNPKYFMWLFAQSAFYSTYIDLFQRGSIIVNLTKSIVYDMPVVLPDIPTQLAITAYLDDKCAAIDGIIAEKEALITELESYKKSLIFETVTGKRRVC